MSEINDSLNTFISKLFTLGNYSQLVRRSLSHGFEYSPNYLQFYIHSDCLSIPSPFFRNSFLSYPENTGRVVVGLSSYLHKIEYKTFPPVMRMLSNSNYRDRKIVFGNSTIYQIGNSILLDEDYEPLLIPFINISRDGFRFYDAVVKISPKLINDNKSFEKKFYPLLLKGLSSKVYKLTPVRRDATNSNNVISFTPKIVIEDLSEYKGKVSDCSFIPNVNSVLNNYLAESVEDIITNINRGNA